MSESKPGLALPYGTYGTLKNTIERFLDSTVPTSLDRHVLDGMSGGDFSALMTALRFLGLAHERSLKPEFRVLVGALKDGPADYKSMMLEIVDNAYKPVVKNVDVKAGTLAEIEKAFKEASGYSGQMLTKAIRFYIRALEDCDVEVSSYITKPRQRTTKPKGTKPAKKTPTGNAGTNRDEEEIPERHRSVVPDGFQRIAIPSNANAFVQFPMAITVKDCDQFEGIMEMLRRFAGIPREGGQP